jgi:cytochrome c
MKKVIYLSLMAAAAIVFAACGSKTETKNTEDYGAEQKSAADASASGGGDAIAQGEALVKANDCKTCHHATNKIIGPAHLDVAKKYDFTDANVKMLADKIIKGGSGNWGDVPMSAHPDLSEADAQKMARYVLSLDGEKEH